MECCVHALTFTLTHAAHDHCWDGCGQRLQFAFSSFRTIMFARLVTIIVKTIKNRVLQIILPTALIWWCKAHTRAYAHSKVCLAFSADTGQWTMIARGTFFRNGWARTHCGRMGASSPMTPNVAMTKTEKQRRYDARDIMQICSVVENMHSIRIRLAARARSHSSERIIILFECR